VCAITDIEVLGPAGTAHLLLSEHFLSINRGANTSLVWKIDYW